MSNIVIVEDSRTVAADISNCLRKANYNVEVICSSVNEAIDYALKNEKDLLYLVDLHLDGEKNGFDLADFLLDQNIPFVFMTASEEEKTIMRIRRYGSKLYLKKPLNDKKLISALNLLSFK